MVAADGLGGAYVCWFYERVANHLSTFVQHVDQNGIVTMAANGIEASPNASTLHLEPAIACDTISHDLYVFWGKPMPIKMFLDYADKRSVWMVR